MMEVKIPAKVMLSGEYSVLYGGTAFMLPVPRYLRITEDSEQNQSVNSPVIEAALNHEIDELKKYESKHGLPQPQINNSEFFTEDSDGNKIKLGLGLSATEAVGIITLRYLRAGFKWEDVAGNIAMHAVQAHSRAQRGSGSGADVATCVFGQPLTFRLKEREVDIDMKNSPSIPLALHYSGHPADTRELVNKFNHWLENGAARAAGMLNLLIDISHKLADSWFTGDRVLLFDLIDSYLDNLNAIASQAKMEYSLEIHDKLNEWAKKHGGRAKPTGAGGGDMILLAGDLPLDQLAGITISLN